MHTLSNMRLTGEMSYNPREYWPSRMKEHGKTYVAFENREEEFDLQFKAFWEAISTYVPRGGRVLDFGCGIGRFALALSGIAEKYDGVDLNEGALQHAPDIENASFSYLEEDRLPFDDDTFDGSVALTVIQHIVEDAAFQLWTSEISRVVKPGGWFFVIDDPQLNKDGRKIKNASHMCRRTPEILSAALNSNLVVTGKLSAESEDSHYFFLSRS